MTGGLWKTCVEKANGESFLLFSGGRTKKGSLTGLPLQLVGYSPAFVAEGCV